MKDAGAFLDEVRRSCDAAGVRLRLEPRALTRTKDLGEFDDSKKILRVATCDPEWWTTLAHEYSHLCQWAEGDPTWESESTEDAKFDAWLAGKRKFPPAELRRIVRVIQRCELDAERRAIQWIRTYHLTDDLVRYARAGNFHIWQYEHARKTGRWIEATPALIAAMPDRLMRKNQIGKPPADFGFPAP